MRHNKEKTLTTRNRVPDEVLKFVASFTLKKKICSSMKCGKLPFSNNLNDCNKEWGTNLANGNQVVQSLIDKIECYCYFLLPWHYSSQKRYFPIGKYGNASVFCFSKCYIYCLLNKIKASDLISTINALQKAHSLTTQHIVDEETCTPQHKSLGNFFQCTSRAGC